MSFTSSSSPSIVGVNRTSLDFNDISRSGSGINGEVQSTGEHPRHSKQNTSDLPHASTLSQRNMSVDLPETRSHTCQESTSQPVMNLWRARVAMSLQFLMHPLKG